LHLELFASLSLLIFIKIRDNFFPDDPEEEKNRKFWVSPGKMKKRLGFYVIQKKAPVSALKAGPKGMTFTFSLLA